MNNVIGHKVNDFWKGVWGKAPTFRKKGLDKRRGMVYNRESVKQIALQKCF